MTEHHLSFSYKARYFQLGQLNRQTKRLIFVIHGYGQQAKYFIKKFKVLDDGHTCIIAPEGLSRFYLEGFDGRIGASWMTREDRLTDIENYLNYLNQLYTSKASEIPQDIQITLLGFSQGSATVSRWAADGKVPFQRLILWAGIFPPDMDFDEASELFSAKDISYVYGVKDPFINQKRFDEMKELSAQLKVKPKVIAFEGKHEILEDVLTQLFVDNG